VAHIIQLGFRQAKVLHPRSTPMIWIRIAEDGTTTKAVWDTSCPTYGKWFPLSAEGLIKLHSWLMTNCYINLGDRVWKQTLGIPMGFSCSPLWCNIYLMHYEIMFVLRLARLNRTDLMRKFKSAYRYIDDLCWINTRNPMDFLSPELCTPENAFWIYPLDVLEIKCEVSKFSEDYPSKGIEAYFMNLDILVTNPDLGIYETRKFDKRRELPFAYTQYIKYNSNRPIKQSYSIAVSQTVPILYLSSSAEILVLIKTLENNGFQEKRPRHLILQNLLNNPFLGLKFDLKLFVSIKKIKFTMLHRSPTSKIFSTTTSHSTHYEPQEAPLCVVQVFDASGSQSLLKKHFLLPSNTIILKSFWSKILNFFPHIPILLLGQILQLKF
jgi:hypothetical protein